MSLSFKALTLTLVLLSGASLAENIVGEIGPPYPKSWKEEGGACIGSSLGRDRICDYSIGILHIGDKRFLYIGKAVAHTDPRKGRWLIVDQMPYPPLHGEERLVLTLCQKDEKRDETIFAVVRPSEDEWHTVLKSAYRANLKTERFEKMTSLKNIRCVNEGWGL